MASAPVRGALVLVALFVLASTSAIAAELYVDPQFGVSKTSNIPYRSPLLAWLRKCLRLRCQGILGQFSACGVPKRLDPARDNRLDPTSPGD
jgi:hypothetical protein